MFWSWTASTSLRRSPGESDFGISGDDARRRLKRSLSPRSRACASFSESGLRSIKSFRTSVCPACRASTCGVLFQPSVQM